MVKKTVQIEIDDENFPMLFKIDKKNLGEMCYDIFETGYQSFFPQQNVQQSTTDDNLKYELLKISNKLTNIDIEDKLEQFENVIEELVGIKMNSHKKGKFSEDTVYRLLQKRFKDYTFEITRGTPHSGDAIMYIPKKDGITKIMIEIKNYTNPVDTDEINKLLNDMKNTNIKHAIIFSFRSGFVGQKQLSIENFQKGNDIYTVLFVPYIMDEFTKIEYSIILMDRITEYYNSLNKVNKSEIHWVNETVTRHLYEMDKIYKFYNDLKLKYLKMENVIKQTLHEFFMDLRNFETDMRDRINSIWKNVNDDLGKAEKILLLNDSDTDKFGIMNILTKHGYECKNNANNISYVIKNEKIVATITKLKKKKVELMLFDKKQRFVFNQPINKKDLINLDDYLNRT